MMTAAARTMVPDTRENDLPIATPAPRSSVWNDRTPTPPVAATPWRAPLFYLAPIAALFLLIAVGIVLLWRVVTRSRSL